MNRKIRQYNKNDENLIATEQGKTIYEKIGFKKELQHEFYIPINRYLKFESKQEFHKATNQDLQQIVDLYFSVTSESRKELIEFYLQGTSLIFDSKQLLRGFYIKDLGDGLIISDNSEDGLKLIKLKLSESKQSFVIPVTNLLVKNFLQENGYFLYKKAQRMLLGNHYTWKSQKIYNRGTGYCG